MGNVKRHPEIQGIWTRKIETASASTTSSLSSSPSRASPDSEFSRSEDFSRGQSGHPSIAPEKAASSNDISSHTTGSDEGTAARNKRVAAKGCEGVQAATLTSVEPEGCVTRDAEGTTAALGGHEAAQDTQGAISHLHGDSLSLRSVDVTLRLQHS